MKIKKKILSLALATMVVFGSIGSTVDALSYKATKTIPIRNNTYKNYRNIGYVPVGGVVDVSTIDRYGWAKVKYNGKTGWVSSTYLRRTNSKATTTTTKKSTTTTSTKKTYKSPRVIIVNKSSRTIRFYKNGKIAFSSYCAIGKPSTPTPNGKRIVREKIVNRPYYKKNIKGGAYNNPLGVRWLGLGGGYGIHGTNVPSSIGTAVSGGCVRLTNNNVVTLYNMVRYGDVVLIGTGSDKSIATRYGYSI